MYLQRIQKYFQPIPLFSILALFHIALLLSLVHGLTITRTIALATPTPSPAQNLQLQDPALPDTTIIFECPANCNGGAACEFVNPTNCSEYINCMVGRAPLVLACEEGTHFWQQLRQCAPPSQAKCTVGLEAVGNVDL